MLVDIDRLLGLAAQVRTAVPADIQEAKEIIRQKESIINQAYLEAQRIREAAEEEARALSNAAQQEHEAKVRESEIVRVAEEKAKEIKEEAMAEAQQIINDAQRRAYRIIQEAEAEADARRDGADQYAREVLFNLEERLAEILGQVRRGIDALTVEVEPNNNRVPA